MKVWEILEYQGRSMAWLAERIGVDKSHVSRLRAGTRNWTEDLKRRASEALGVPVELAFSSNSGERDVDAERMRAPEGAGS